MQHTMWFSTDFSPNAADLHQAVVAHLRDWVDCAINDAAAVTLLTSHLDTSELNFEDQPNMRLMFTIFATFHSDTSESNKGELPNALSAWVTLLTSHLLKSALKSRLEKWTGKKNSKTRWQKCEFKCIVPTSSLDLTESGRKVSRKMETKKKLKN